MYRHPCFVGIQCLHLSRKMKAIRLIARSKQKYVNTTDSSHNYKVAENLPYRQFAVDQFNTFWLSDITYIRMVSKWMYLITIIDLADRMVVGWTLSHNMSTRDAVNQALKNALSKRGIKKRSKLFVHPDRGIQYASK